VGFFDRKPKVSTAELCQQFYDSYIFHPMIANIEFNEAWWGTIFDSIVWADQSFANINQDVFIREMTAIRLELFGLAWGKRYKQDEDAISQSVFTRNYLRRNGNPEIWRIMGEYNTTIAESVTMTESGEQMDAWRVSKANKKRVDLFDKWAEANISDPSAITEEEKRQANCVAHVFNCIGADISRNDCITVKRLAAKLADRLDCEPTLSIEALSRLGAAIFGLYKGAEDAIKSLG
jgi:hypothetical protein